MDAQNIDNPYWDTVTKIPHSRYAIKDYPFSPGSDGNLLDRSLPDDTPSRDMLVRKYSWAIPSPETLDLIAQHLDGREVVEIGAGTGYWAKMLSQLGIKVHAFDTSPPNEEVNGWHAPKVSVEHRHTEETIADWREMHEATLAITRLLESAFGAPGPDGGMEAIFGNPQEPSVGDPYLIQGPSQEMVDVFYPVKRGGVERAAQYPDAALFLCWPPYNTSMAYDALRFYSGDMLIYCGEGRGGCTASDPFFQLVAEEWELVAENSSTHIAWDGIRDSVAIFTRKEVRA